jgi:hypothetical protein
LRQIVLTTNGANVDSDRQYCYGCHSYRKHSRPQRSLQLRPHVRHHYSHIRTKFECAIRENRLPNTTSTRARARQRSGVHLSTIARCCASEAFASTPATLTYMARDSPVKVRPPQEHASTRRGSRCDFRLSPVGKEPVDPSPSGGGADSRGRRNTRLFRRR